MGFQEGIYTQGQNVAFEKYASYAGKHFPGLLSHMEQPLEGFRKSFTPGLSVVLRSEQEAYKRH